MFRRACLTRILLAWLACGALLLGGLLPRAAMALPGGTIEVCTAQGSRWLQPAGGARDGSQDERGAPGAAHEHCKACSASALDQAIPPPAMCSLLLPRAPRALLPLLFMRAPRPLFAWAATRPRGPPLQS